MTFLSGAFGLALMAAILWGCGAFLEKIAMKGGDPMAGVFIRAAVAFVASAGFFTMAPHGWRPLTGSPPLSIILFVITGITSMVLGQALFFQALRHGEASRVVPISGTYPLIAAILSVIFLGEPLTAKKAIAVLLIVSGIALLK